jgi:flagellar basal body rod protein FlgC
MPLDRIASATAYSALQLVRATASVAPRLETPPRPAAGANRAAFTVSERIPGVGSVPFPGGSMAMAVNGVSSNIPQSGIAMALQRVDVAANNTANRETEGFQRQRVEQSAAPNGGVQARTVTTNAPNNTTEAAVRDALDARAASREVEANAAVFRTREDALGSLFDDRA